MERSRAYERVNWGPGKALGEMANDAPVFRPGSEQRYSTADFVLLGAIIERLSEEDYYRYVSTHVLAPADMTATAFNPARSRPRKTYGVSSWRVVRVEFRTAECRRALLQRLRECAGYGRQTSIPHRLARSRDTTRRRSA